MKTDPVLQQLEMAHARACADERIAWEAFQAAVQTSYMDPGRALNRMQMHIERWGVDRTIEMLERKPTRFGWRSAAWYTPDGWTYNAPAREKHAREVLPQLADLARELGDAQSRQRHARNAYEVYCRERKIEVRHPWEYENGTTGPVRPDAADQQERLDQARRETRELPRADEREQARVIRNEPHAEAPRRDEARPDQHAHDLDWLENGRAKAWERVPGVAHEHPAEPGRRLDEKSVDGREDHLDWLRDELEKERPLAEELDRERSR